MGRDRKGVMELATILKGQECHWLSLFLPHCRIVFSVYISVTQRKVMKSSRLKIGIFLSKLKLSSEKKGSLKEGTNEFRVC